MDDLIDLSSGQVVEALPEAAIKALSDAVASDRVTAYAPMAGEARLRTAVAGHYARRTGADADPAHVTVTAGARHGLFCVATAVARDAEVLVPRPHWSHYPEMLRLAGACPVFVPGAPDAGLLVHPGLLEAARTPRTKAVIVNSPVNPTGSGYGPQELTALRDWARHRDVRLIIDDIYWAYGGDESGGVRPGRHEIVVGGASKVHALAGARIGWVWADPALTATLRGIVEHTTGPVSTLAQAAAAAVVEDDEAVPERSRRMSDQRAHAIRELTRVPLLRVLRPRGGIYLCLDASRLAAARPEWRDDRLLCADLESAAGVKVRAGSTFGLPGYLRLCVAVPPERLSEAARRMAKFVRATDRSG